MSVLGGVFGGMMASAGSTFLNTMAQGHGQTMGSRILRPYQNFETPWGKGPYYDEAMMIRGEEREYKRQDTAIQRRVADAKAAGLHPLFAMGMQGSSPTFSGGAPRAQRAPISRGAGSMPAQGLLRAATMGGAEKRANEEHDMNIERGHIENLKAASELALLQQRLQAGDIELGSYRNPADLPPAETMTKKNVLRGPFGGAYQMPEGVSPQREWEDRIGEGSDWTFGPGIFARILMERQKRMRGMKRQIMAVKRHRARKKYPRFEKWKKDWFGPRKPHAGGGGY